MNHKKKYKVHDVFYLQKKHFCPDCQSRMKKVTESKIVDKYSPEAWNVRTKDKIYLQTGPIEYMWTELKCSDCGKQLTVDEMKKLENIDPDKSKQIKIIIGVILLIAYLILQFYLRQQAPAG